MNDSHITSLSFCLCTYFINRLELWWSINVFYYVIESSWTHLIFIKKISYNMMKFSINPFSDIVWSNHDNSSVMKWQWPLTTRFSCTKGNLELHGQVMYYNVDVRLALIIAFCKYGNNVAWLVKLLINFSICSVKIRFLKALAQCFWHHVHTIPLASSRSHGLPTAHFGKKKNLVGFFSYSFIFSCWWSVLRFVDFELSPFWFTIVTYF